MNNSWRPRISFLAVFLVVIGLIFVHKTLARGLTYSDAKHCIAVRRGSEYPMQSAPLPLILQGKIEKVYSFGPPGYGEAPRTDRKDLRYLLRLDKPINICYFGKPYSLYKNITVLGDVNNNFFADQRIKASGVIWEPDTAEAAIPGAHFNLDLTQVCLMNDGVNGGKSKCQSPPPPLWETGAKAPPISVTRALNPGAVGKVSEVIDSTGASVFRMPPHEG